MNEIWKPSIAVVGAGALGSVFGGLLYEGGLNIWQDHVKAINRQGLKIVGYGGDRYIPIAATSNPSQLSPIDVVFVQCKAPNTVEAMTQAQNIITDDTVVISFQNGLGNEEIISDVIGHEHVLGGVTAQGVSVVEAGGQELQRSANTYWRDARWSLRAGHADCGCFD